MMKQLMMISLGLLLMVGPAEAGTGPQDIANTLHNLSSSGLASNDYASVEFNSDSEDEICVYCHTPHGGVLDGPLWNRNFANDGTGYTFYSSDTLAAETAGVAQITAASLLCLSCHDGSVAVGDDLINTSSGTLPDNKAAWGIIQPAFTEPGPRVGGSRATPSGTTDLSDDHPISFNYVTAQGQDTSLRNIDDASGPKALGLRFYGAGQNYLECGTCHDPHVSYDSLHGGDENYRPFLAVPNTGSQMCFACHIK